MSIDGFKWDAPATKEYAAAFGYSGAGPDDPGRAAFPKARVVTVSAAVTQYIGLYNRLHGTRHSIMRLANVYGPRQDPGGDAGVIPIFCGAAAAGHELTVYGDGTQTRDYVYVGDVVSAFLAAANAGRPGIWNIGTGAETSVLDLARIIAEASGRPLRPRFSPPRQGELQRSVLAVSRATQDLGWQPCTRLAEGISHVYRWIQAGAPDRAPC